MIDGHDDLQRGGEDVAMLAKLTEEITCRLESGEPISGGNCMEENPASAGPIRQLLPTLRTMVSLGEQIDREEGSRDRLRRKKGSSDFRVGETQ
jgi:hypothetical protein